MVIIYYSGTGVELEPDWSRTGAGLELDWSRCGCVIPTI